MSLRTLARAIADAAARGPITPAAPLAPITATVVSTQKATDYRSPRHEQLDARRARCRAYWASQEARAESPDDVIDGDASFMVAGDIQDPAADRAELERGPVEFVPQFIGDDPLDRRLAEIDRAPGDRLSNENDRERARSGYNRRQLEIQTEHARAQLAGRAKPAEEAHPVSAADGYTLSFEEARRRGPTGGV